MIRHRLLVCVALVAALALPASAARLVKDDGAPRLTESGAIDPFRVYFSQDNIKGEFRDARLENPDLTALRDHLRSGAVQPSAVPPIRIFWHKPWARWISLDNRRLWAFREARMKSIRYRKATQAELDAESSRKLTTKNRGEAIEIRGGLR